MYQITASIVTYKNNINVLTKAIDSFLNTDLDVKIYIIDNSPNNAIQNALKNDSRIEYIFNNANIGFGKAHNIVLRKSQNESQYHIVLNPDIDFNSGVLEELYSFMESNKDIGFVMPKILYPDDSIQYLCKLIPSPFDLILRRFMPFKKYREFKKNRYELRFSGYDKIMDVPVLSGCFMFLRSEILKTIGFFDDRYFMYLEDVDLCRRIGEKFRTTFYPNVSVVHHYEKGSYRNYVLLKHHMFSAISYFNKWGWFFDNKRKIINRNCVKEILTQTGKKEKNLI